MNEFLGNYRIGQPLFGDFVDPQISFDDTSFTALFSTFDYRLIGDGIAQVYDITTVVIDAPATIPLPATAPLLLAGLAGFAAFHRRNFS